MHSHDAQEAACKRFPVLTSCVSVPQRIDAYTAHPSSHNAFHGWKGGIHVRLDGSVIAPHVQVKRCLRNQTGERIYISGGDAVRMRDVALRSTYVAGGDAGAKAIGNGRTAALVRRSVAWTESMACRRHDVRLAAFRTRHWTCSGGRMHVPGRTRRR